jgi:hypothetical protein
MCVDAAAGMSSSSAHGNDLGWHGLVEELCMLWDGLAFAAQGIVLHEGCAQGTYACQSASGAMWLACRAARSGQVIMAGQGLQARVCLWTDDSSGAVCGTVLACCCAVSQHLKNRDLLLQLLC